MGLLQVGMGVKEATSTSFPLLGSLRFRLYRKRIRGTQGGNGKGTWMSGRSAGPTIIKVPVGTIVRELANEDSRRAQDEWEAEEEGLQDLSPAEKIAKMRERRWLHYPGATDDNLGREAFREAEKILYRQERDRRILRREQQKDPLFLDLDAPVTSSSKDIQSGLEIGHQAIENLGYIVATGGEGGLGNPAFLSTDNRSPKFATRGTEGQRITLSLELKILADIGLVGYPNAGKSTLLRALTGGRAKTEVAGYAFTTLNPVVGVVRMDSRGNVLGSEEENLVIDETRPEAERFKERLDRGDFAHTLSQNKSVLDMEEMFRFTVADNPGLISQASEDVGLGHSFLRSIERSLALVYVVDFSGPDSDPERELRILRDELETYKPGLSRKARLVIANKADLLGVGSNQSVEEAREKLQRLEAFVRSDLDENMPEIGQKTNRLDVVPVSAKFSQNLQKVLLLLRSYVEEATR
ncbi:hypothetical protein EW145_g6895 [Phellinidium pouzarii]|uniref:OBG-type G domain-containing protein n=1 Tax=Phellinidium pouzarii TaxID=167371 RepID=A0A4S4KSK5_9AGAM|nr:hypothetical protein EW145_g6895 [Phellinidium pouzarii]